MATVPRLEENPVATAPLPGVRVAVDVPAGAFGVTGAPDLAGLQQHVTNIVERERAKADTVALLDADNQLAKLQTDLHSKARELRGRDAMGATDLVAQGWQKGTADIAKSLKTDTQRRAFANRVGNRWNALYEATETHAADERDKYVKGTAQDALDLRLSHATEFYQQPSQVQTAIDESKAIITDWATHEGWAPETIALRKAMATSNIHSGVINRMVANRQDLGAAEYLQAHREELTADQLIKAESLVTSASVQGAGQRAADGIVKSAANLTDALAAAGQILNPLVRDEAEQRVRRTFEDRSTAQRLRQADQNREASAIIRKTGSIDNVPKNLLVGWTSDQLRDLKLFEESWRRRPSDQDTVIKLRNLSGLDPAAFSRLELADYRDQLSDADLRALQTTQRTIRQSATRTEATTRTRQQKELAKAKKTASFYESQKLPVPEATTSTIRALTDSLKVGGGTPAVPGAPLPTTAPKKPAGSGGVLPSLTPAGTKPPEEGAPIASVPAEWLAHARENPDYAAYLAAMGVAVE